MDSDYDEHMWKQEAVIRNRVNLDYPWMINYDFEEAEYKIILMDLNYLKSQWKI